MLLPAPPNPAIASKVTMEIADKVLRILKRYYSVIIIDGGPKIQPAVDAAMQHATHILLIANPEGQSVENLSRVVNFVSPDPNSPEKPDFSYLMNKMYLVINRIRGSKAELTPTQIAEFVKRPIIAQILMMTLFQWLYTQETVSRRLNTIRIRSFQLLSRNWQMT